MSEAKAMIAVAAISTVLILAGIWLVRYVAKRVRK
jgi:hypothetical protein